MSRTTMMGRVIDKGRHWWVWNINEQTDELTKHKGPFGDKKPKQYLPNPTAI